MTSIPFRDLFHKAVTQLKALSAREQLILALALVVGVIVGGSKISKSVSAAFESQRSRLQQATSAAEQNATLVSSYREALSQKRTIEQRYSRIGPPEGALSYLETLTKEKIGVNPSIDDLQPRPFGGNFQQLPFRIRFQSNDLAKVSSLLQELTKGKQRYLLTNITITPRGTQSLDIVLEVSSLGKKGSTQSQLAEGTT